MPTPALDGLVRALHEEFQSHSRSARIAELLRNYASSHQDWREFALFSPERYTRNLVALEPEFELMVLCWGAGQESAIHNHEGQDCWMAVLEGEIEELRYPMPAQPGPIRVRGTSRFHSGQVAFIRDELGLHLVRPASPGAGVTLHLYAAPYAECNCYCPETGVVTRRRLGHHSVRGRVLGEGKTVSG